MADPYFNDPLLQRWYLDCLHDPHRAHVRRHLSPQTDVGGVLCWSHPNMPVGQHMDLRSIVRAELLAAQEMREVLKAVEWRGDMHTYAACPVCGGLQPDQLPDGDEFAELRASHKEGHATDCRLARLIGEKP